MTCKLNIEKIYNCIIWIFFIAILGKKGLARNGSTGFSGAPVQH